MKFLSLSPLVASLNSSAIPGTKIHTGHIIDPTFPDLNIFNKENASQFVQYTTIRRVFYQFFFFFNWIDGSVYKNISIQPIYLNLYIDYIPFNSRPRS